MPAELLDHAFMPMTRDGRYCGYMSRPVTTGSAEHGTIAFRSECGYPPDCHRPPVPRDPPRCDARATKGTGEGICDRLLDEHGQCDRAGAHL
jgi:hypothetical protein